LEISLGIMPIVMAIWLAPASVIISTRRKPKAADLCNAEAVHLVRAAPEGVIVGRQTCGGITRMFAVNTLF
jgi:hypothetical protein